ncbi:cupin domain-containing protein [Nodosilinea sp. P-1105]|nr:cupin domain-containing protein [Nodosilinea sp. P-1105]
MLETHFSVKRWVKTVILSFITLAIVGSCALAVAPDNAILWPVDDPQLEWGACPDFFPEGCELAVLQGDPEENNSDIFFKVPPNSELPPHYHTSAERMALVSGNLQLTFAGQDLMEIEPGNYIYGPAELAHEGFCAPGDPCVLFIAFELPIDAIPVEQLEQT